MPKEFTQNPQEQPADPTIIDQIESLLADVKPAELLQSVMATWDQLAPPDRLDIQSTAARASTPEDPHGARTAFELVLLYGSNSRPDKDTGGSSN